MILLPLVSLAQATGGQSSGKPGQQDLAWAKAVGSKLARRWWSGNSGYSGSRQQQTTLTSDALQRERMTETGPRTVVVCCWFASESLL